MNINNCLQYLSESLFRRGTVCCNNSGLERPSLVVFLTIFCTLACIAATIPSVALAGYVDPSTCGAIGQKPCELSEAKNLGKVYVKNPGGGAFHDIGRDEWWKCPSTHPTRSTLAVNESQACETSVPVVVTTPGEPFRNGEDIWQCPSTHPRRTVLAVDGASACEVKSGGPGGGAFLDIGRDEWWNCDGWRRTVFSVTAGNACETGDIFSGVKTKRARFISKSKSSANKIGSTFISAIFVSAGKYPKPSGAFTDPRLDKNLLGTEAEYWTCPSGFWRNLNPVTHSAACTVNVGQNCESGNIAVGTPWGGYTCEKRGVCGANGQRPCQIVERIPSCNSGLAEDFVDGTCIDDKLAMCLTITRALWLGKHAETGLNEAMKAIEKPVNAALNELIKAIPKDVRDTLDKGAEAIQTEVVDPIQDKIDENLTRVMDQFDTGPLAQFETIANSIKSMPDQSAVVDLFADPSLCTASQDQLKTKLASVLGPLDFSQTFAMVNQPWYANAMDAVIPSAHAAYPMMRWWGTAGINGQLILGTGKGGVGLSLDLSLVVGGGEGTGDVGLLAAIGPVFAYNAPVFQVSPYLGMRWGYDFANLGGPNLSLGLQFPLKIKKLGTYDETTKRWDYPDVGIEVGIRLPDPTGEINDYARYFHTSQTGVGGVIAGVIEGVTITPWSKESEQENKVSKPILKKIVGEHLGGKGNDGGIELSATMGWEFLLIGYGGETNSAVWSFKPMPTSTGTTVTLSKPSPQSDAISLLTHNGKYLGVKSDGTVYTGSNRDIWELFTLIDNGDSTISLKSNHNTYLWVDQGGTVKSDATELGDWGKFTKIANTDGTVSFKSYHGRYLWVDRGGAVKGDATDLAGWGKFRMSKTLSFVTHLDTYLRAKDNGEVDTGPNLEIWEKFIAIPDVNGKIGLQSYHRTFLWVDKEGKIKSDATSLADWGKFSVITNPDGTISLKSHHGKYLWLDAGGQIKADATSIGAFGKFRFPGPF